MSSNASESDSGLRGTQKMLGGYELLGKIGQGAMGAVFKARQVSMNRTVALKVMPQRLAKNKEFVARFLREAHSAGKLNQPCIVQAFDAGEADGYYYIAMEYIDGPCLDDVLETDGALPEQQALEIARDIAKALGYAHKAGLIHRDVKPANILLTSEWEAKLADLGLARESAVNDDSNLTNVGIALGTPDYMAPEQVRGDANIDGRCDTYSLGATLYHLLVGRPPFKGGTRAEIMSKHLTARAPNPRKANPDISAAAAAIIQKAMAKKRDARYADAAEMLAALEAVIEGEPAAAAGGAKRSSALSRTREQAGRPGSRKWLYAGLGTAAAALIASGVYVALFTGPKTHIPVNEHTSDPTETVQTPPPTPRKTPAETDAERLAAVRQWTKDHPNEYSAAIGRYRDAISQLTTSAAKSEAEAELQALEHERAAPMKEAKAALASAQSHAATLAKAGNYDGAIAVFDKLPAQFASMLADSAKKAKERLKAEAVIKVKTVLDEARKLGADDKCDEALAQLKQLDGLRYAAALPKIQDVRAELLANQLKAREAAERARQQRLLSAFRARLPAALRAHQFEALATRLGELIADPSLNTIKKEAEADRRVVEKLSALLQRIRSNTKAEARKTAKTTTRWKGIPATVQAYDSETGTVRFNRGKQTLTDMRATDLKALLDLDPGPANEYHEHLALLFIAESTPEDAKTHMEQAADPTLIRHLQKMLGAVDAGTAEPGNDPAPAGKEAVLAMWKSSQALYKEYCGHLEKKRTKAREACRQSMTGEIETIKKRIAKLNVTVAELREEMSSTSSESSIRYSERQREEALRSITQLRNSIPSVGKKARARLKLIDSKTMARKTSLQALLLRHKKALDLGRAFTEKQMRAAYEKIVPAEPNEE